MSIYRKNMITNDWVIFAPNRAKRPKELKSNEEDNIEVLQKRSDHKETCPFCIGNEKHDDKEILRINNKDGWSVRILENKFASVGRTVVPNKRNFKMEKEMDGFGIHDVIIDHSNHNTTIGLMSIEDIMHLLKAYLIRYKQIQEDKNVRHIVIFKNQGIKAGGSLEHPHSQIYGLPVIPFDTVIRLKEEEKYFDFTNECLLCNIMKEELESKIRIICENEHFSCYSPYAALSPYHLWIVPKRHSPSFSLIEKNELAGFAEILQIVFKKIFYFLRNPDFNFIIQSLSRFESEKDYFHWYLSFIPHIKTKGGLETAGGMFVNTIMPETAAEELRDFNTDEL